MNTYTVFAHYEGLKGSDDVFELTFKNPVHKGDSIEIYGTKPGTECIRFEVLDVIHCTDCSVIQCEVTLDNIEKAYLMKLRKQIKAAHKKETAK